jgi:hypothetical protein
VLLVLEAAYGLVGAPDHFSPKDGVLGGAAFFALAQVALFAWAIGGLRLANGGTLFFPGARKPIESTSQVVVLALVLFVFVWIVDAMSVSARLDRLLGKHWVARGRIEALTQTAGKGCHFHAQVASPATEDFSFCVDESLWNRLAPGEPLQLDLVDGPLGQTISVDRQELQARHHGG